MTTFFPVFSSPRPKVGHRPWGASTQPDTDSEVIHRGRSRPGEAGTGRPRVDNSAAPQPLAVGNMPSCSSRAKTQPRSTQPVPVRTSVDHRPASLVLCRGLRELAPRGPRIRSTGSQDIGGGHANNRKERR